MTIVDRAIYTLLPQDTAAPHVTERKILGFRELGDGWHYGEGVLPKNSVLDDAISLNQEAVRLAFFETDVFPGINGEVMLTVYYCNHYLEFTIEPDGSVTFYREKDNEEVCYQEGLSFQEAKAKIGEFRKETWKEYEFSTESAIMTGESTDLSVSHLRTQETTPESLLLADSAYFNLEQRFVDTSDYTIEELQAIPLFSGASQQRYYLPVTG